MDDESRDPYQQSLFSVTSAFSVPPHQMGAGAPAPTPPASPEQSPSQQLQRIASLISQAIDEVVVTPESEYQLDLLQEALDLTRKHG